MDGAPEKWTRHTFRMEHRCRDTRAARGGGAHTEDSTAGTSMAVCPPLAAGCTCQGTALTRRCVCESDRHLHGPNTAPQLSLRPLQAPAQPAGCMWEKGRGGTGRTDCQELPAASCRHWIYHGPAATQLHASPTLHSACAHVPYSPQKYAPLWPGAVSAHTQMSEVMAVSTPGPGTVLEPAPGGDAAVEGGARPQAGPPCCTWKQSPGGPRVLQHSQGLVF